MLHGCELRRPRRRGPWAAVLAGAGDVRTAEEGEAQLKEEEAELEADLAA